MGDEFVGRERELAFLQQVVARRRPGPAQLILLYGRRRVGKTSLLRHWAATSGLPTVYWTAEKEPAALQRRKLAATVLGLPPAQAPAPATWAESHSATTPRISASGRISTRGILVSALRAAPTTSAVMAAPPSTWSNAVSNPVQSITFLRCGRRRAPRAGTTGRP